MPDDFDASATNIGTATQRAAEALLRALGDGGIVLRLPLPPVAANADLGMAAPLTEDVELAPAALLAIRPEADGRTRYQADIAAEAVEEEVERRNLESADAFFAGALGIVAGDKLLRIVSATPHACGATIYLYRLQAIG